MSAPPQISPDGKFYWDGQRWVALPTSRSGRPSASPWVIALLVVVGLVIVILASLHSPFDVKVTRWAPASSTVSGTIKNNGSACSDPEITLHLRDRNNAIVREFTFGTGELASGASRDWTTHMIGLFGVDAPAEAAIVVVDADATCADRH